MNLEQRNADLDKKLKDTDIPQAIDTLIKDAKRRKRHVRLLAISLALDVLLTVAFGYISIRTADLASKADSNRAALVRSCETANQSRSDNREIWDYVLELSQRPSTTPAEQETRDKFVAKVNETFKPRNCSEVVE